MKTRKYLPGCILLAVLMGSAGRIQSADKEAPSKTEAKPEAPATHKVKRGVLKFKTQLDAIVEATEMAPIALAPEAWATLVVQEAVPHGKKVTRGEVVVRLKTKDLEKQIRALELGQPAAAIARELAELELENLEQTTPLKLAAAQRANRVAKEDYDYFEKTGRAQREKSTRWSLKSAEQRLEGAREELKQLQEMYEADDLTEETEEIVLKRQKYAVEVAEYSLESARLRAELSLNTSIPREEESLLAAKRDQEFALQLAESSLPRNLSKKRLDLAKLKRDQVEANEKLAKLKRDLKSLRVRAPMDGIVYYGMCDHGKWTTGPIAAKKLVPGGKVMPREVLMTIVNPEHLQLRAVAPEAALARLQPGLKGQAKPVSAPGKKLNVTVKAIDFVPLVSGGFDTTISLETTASLHLLPGMTCKVEFDHSGKAPQLLVPKSAVTEDQGQKVVYLKTNAKPKKRVVKTGEADDKMVEVLEGLAEGDEVLLQKPE